MSGTLRNPSGGFYQLTMPKFSISGSRRFEITLTSDAIRRLHALKKALGFRKRSEVVEALLFQAAVEKKIDPYLSDRLEQKIDYLVERMELLS